MEPPDESETDSSHVSEGSDETGHDSVVVSVAVRDEGEVGSVGHLEGREWEGGRKGQRWEREGKNRWRSETDLVGESDSDDEEGHSGERRDFGDGEPLSETDAEKGGEKRRRSASGF